MKTCSVGICDREAWAKGWCHAHYQRVSRYGDLRPADPIGQPVHAGLKGEENPRWAGDQVGYPGAHYRVQQARGPASAHECVDCGLRATHWSYIGEDPNELQGKAHRDDPYELAYSLDPNYYTPRCARCHVHHDRRKESANED